MILVKLLKRSDFDSLLLVSKDIYKKLTGWVDRLLMLSAEIVETLLYPEAATEGSYSHTSVNSARQGFDSNRALEGEV